MTDMNLFSQDDQSNAEQVPDNIDYAAELVGEGKRYKDIAALAKGKVDGDAFIGRLQAELKVLRSQLQGEQKIDAFLDQVKNLNKPAASAQSNLDNQASENAGNQNINTNNTNQNASSISLQDVESLLEKRERVRTEAQNFNYAVEKVKEAYGADYKATLATITQTLGATPEFMNDLAKTQPQAFLKLVGVTGASGKATPLPNGNVRSNGLSASNASGEKNAAYYSELRKKIGNDAYYSRDIQNEIHRQALKLGEAFFN